MIRATHRTAKPLIKDPFMRDLAIDDPVFISTEEAAKRLDISIRRVQALIASGRLPAQKKGRDYEIWSADLERVKSRAPGRLRHLTVSDGILGPRTADVKSDIQRAHTEEEMQAVLDDYVTLLEDELSSPYKPGESPLDIALTNTSVVVRSLDADRQEMWRPVLIRTETRHRIQRLADHLRREHHLLTKLRLKNDLEWCVDLYRKDGSGPTTTIYQAAVWDI
jgi:excisionase family DNA binding protein